MYCRIMKRGRVTGNWGGSGGGGIHERKKRVNVTSLVLSHSGTYSKVVFKICIALRWAKIGFLPLLFCLFSLLMESMVIDISTTS